MTLQGAEPTVPESAWSKSSYSSGGGGECVEVAAALATVHVRDSKNPDGQVLTVSPAAWSPFVRLVGDRLG
ncbi:DUF397 domain-containing protein [Streptomyces sp. RKND-216]|uniref:DUF397 domain-containing protein n=1 Tax=Streptomyces sp. RKND-216 TaxID=2562581 RepID=UPI00109D9490|nr:DUF397 domain-containing protein [Streptomyces sp. RKND-216]THA23700.1 DUF397 domain-containing protein [Streptomyces sp. RKND-216]